MKPPADANLPTRRTFLALAAGASALPVFAGRGAFAQPPPDDLTGQSLTDVAALVRSKKVSPVELTRACLSRIERLNPSLNAFITVTDVTALAQARTAEAEIARGKWRGPLHGIPIALKDNVDTAGVRTTAASNVLSGRVPEQDAEVVIRLRAAGAVSLGKLNMHEFAYGGTSLVSHFGPVRNPWRKDYITGGSSGGSAAALAAGLCFGALGTDTGGSIRLPASFCGIAGLKPTYGRVSLRGVLPLAWSLDHIGPMARSVADLAAILQAIAGYDEADATSVDKAVPDYGRALAERVRPFRLGVPREYASSLDPEVDSAFRDALVTLKGVSAGIQDISFPLASDDRTTIRAAEAWAYHVMTVAKTPDLYDPETLSRIRAGETIGAIAYIEAHRRMERVRREVATTFKNVDILATPTVPILPTPAAATPADDTPRIRNVAPFNLNGLPAVSIPCGFSSTGLPIGLQLVGPPWGEERLLAIAAAYEKATAWHNRRPAEGSA
ncbi:MAG TPA: amidase [Vicinamibacterales bacterium]|nr:amidase [Vicinamibacterales bacterium]